MKYLCLLFILVALPVVTLVTVGSEAFADEYERQWEDDDYAYDRARRAVGRGEALQISEVLERLKTQVPGEVVGIEFEREHGKWIYEFKVIDNNGRLVEVYVDAHTGKVLSMEEE